MRRSGGAPAAPPTTDGFTGATGAALLFGLVIMVTHGFGNSLVPAMLPRIAESFQAGYGVLGLAVATGLLAYGLGALLGIAILDRVPPRGLLALCLAVCTAGFLAVSRAGSPVMLALCVVAVGLASPISWSVTVHIVGQVVRPSSHGRVLSVASVGAGIGSGVNGVFVLVFAGPERWRWAFIIAGTLAILALVATLLVLRHPVDCPSRPERADPQRSVGRRIWSVPAGRLVILLSMFAGIGGFTFAGYLSEVAVDELMVSPLAAGVPWWLASAVGLALAIPLGAVADRGSPLGVITLMVLAYAISLTVLAFSWSYPGLLIASCGFAVLNFPLWGLLGLAAHRGLPSELAMRTVSGGLVAGAWFAMSGITAAGLWIDRTGSFRVPVIVLAAMTALVSVWLVIEYRAESRDRFTGGRRAPTMLVREEAGRPAMNDCGPTDV